MKNTYSQNKLGTTIIETLNRCLHDLNDRYKKIDEALDESEDVNYDDLIMEQPVLPRSKFPDFQYSEEEGSIGALCVIVYEGRLFFDYAKSCSELRPDWMQRLLRQEFLQQIRNHMYDLSADGTADYEDPESIVASIETELVAITSATNEIISIATQEEYEQLLPQVKNGDSYLCLIGKNVLSESETTIELLKTTNGIYADSKYENGVTTEIEIGNGNYRGPFSYLFFMLHLGGLRHQSGFWFRYTKGYNDFLAQISETVAVEAQYFLEDNDLEATLDIKNFRLFLRQDENNLMPLSDQEAFDQYITNAPKEPILFFYDTRKSPAETIGLLEEAYSTTLKGQ